MQPLACLYPARRLGKEKASWHSGANVVTHFQPPVSPPVTLCLGNTAEGAGIGVPQRETGEFCGY